MNAATVWVELLSDECVVERGTMKTTWWVRNADSWLAAHEWPGALEKEPNARPGTIWESRLELQLPVGQLLMRVESRPAAARQRDALDYLSRETRSTARSTRRSYYRVGRRGELKPAEPNAAR